jgi:hypothetical protein
MPSSPSVSSGIEPGVARYQQAKPVKQLPTSQGKDWTATKTPTPPSVNIVLSDEQKDVLRRVERGENVFFTGSAGA